MLEMHDRRAALFLEIDLDGGFQVGVVDKFAIELPRKNEPTWRLIGNDATPSIFGAVGAFFIPSAASARFDHDVNLRRALRNAVLLVPPFAHTGCEHFESAVDRRVDGDRLADGCGRDAID